jgi:hypothetical protein
VRLDEATQEEGGRQQQHSAAHQRALELGQHRADLGRGAIGLRAGDEALREAFRAAPLRGIHDAGAEPRPAGPAGAGNTAASRGAGAAAAAGE